MARVVLLYDRDCPNVGAARSNLLRAFVEARVPARWDEVDRAASDTPAAWRGYGSPAVLVDGHDVAGLDPSGGDATCRLYLDRGARHRAPPVAMIASALARDLRAGRPSAPSGTEAGGRVGALLAAAPGIGMALLPKVACPACWPAYAGVLSSLGLGFLLDTRYLLPLTVAFVGVTLGSLGWRARRRRGLGPLVLGAVAAVALLVGKFVYELDAAMYGGVAALVVASLWNAWPSRAAPVTPGSCPSCAPRPGADDSDGEPSTTRKEQCQGER